MNLKFAMIVPALLTGLLLSSCQWLQQNVPVVNNRDADGTFTTPNCPKCGERFVRSATVYGCNNNHAGVTVWTGEVNEGTENAPRLRK